jgi:hypothetical protein
MSNTASPAAAPSQEAAQRILQLGTGYIASSALQIATRLKIADRLAAAPRSVGELAAETGAQEDALYRVMRALASLGVFQEAEARRFSVTPAAELLRSDVPGSFYDMVLWLTDPFHFRTYAELTHSVHTGQPAVEKVEGVPVFEHLARDRALSDVFNNAMTAFSRTVIPAVLHEYDFTGINLLVDVAGGHGEILMSILRDYPSMRGVLFDVDHVIAGAKPRIAAAGLNDRCETATGDFFEAVPAGGDAYIMKHIIHDWDDDRALVILKNIRAAIEGRKHARLILIEAVIHGGNQPDVGKLIDLEMLVLPGGRERTAEEFRLLFSRAGFAMTRIVPTRSPLSVIEGVAG